MHFRALIGVVFLGLAARGFGRGGPIANDARTGAPTTGEPSASEAPAGVTFPNFKPAEFPFVTTMPDDGTDKGGGWQVAKANLEFTRISLPFTVIKWYCPFTIEMPLRPKREGKSHPAVRPP